MNRIRVPHWLSIALPIVVAGALLFAAFHPTGLAASAGLNSLSLPIPDDQATITNGILILGIALVLVIVIGVLLGNQETSRRNHKNK